MDSLLHSFTGLSLSNRNSLDFPVKTAVSPSSSFSSRFSFSSSSLSFSRNFNSTLRYTVPPRENRRSKPLVVVAAANGSQCEEYSGLNAPLKPRSSVGSYLSNVLLDDKEFFLVAAKNQLEKLAGDRRDAAALRMSLSSDSGESLLHRYNVLPNFFLLETLLFSSGPFSPFSLLIPGFGLLG